MSASAVTPFVQAAHRRLVSAPRFLRPVNVLDRSSATITVALYTTGRRRLGADINRRWAAWTTGITAEALTNVSGRERFCGAAG